MFKNQLFTHKILPIIGLVLFILFVFSINCFASVVIEEGDNQVTLPDLPNDCSNYYFIVTNFRYSGAYDTYNLFYVDNPKNHNIIVQRTGEDSKFLYFYDTDDELILDYYNYKLINNEWSQKDLGTSSINSGQPEYLINCIKLSSVDILNTDGTIFFQGTPLVPQVQLMNPMEVEEIPQLITNLLTILVPVGLTIFGILLLVYLLGSRRWLMH